RQLSSDGRAQPRSVGVTMVVATSEVLEVGQTVVLLVAVDVVHVLPVGRTNECQRHKAMNASGDVAVVHAEADGDVARLRMPRRAEHLPCARLAAANSA